MGGDGGCIATQREFMRGTYGSAHSKGGWAQGQNHGSGTTGGDAEHGDFTNRRRAIRVRSCALSGDALKAPVVSDAFGQLFNKLDVLKQLSSKSLPEAFSHIRGLRDLIDVKSQPPKGSSQDYVHGDGWVDVMAAANEVYLYGNKLSQWVPEDVTTTGATGVYAADVDGDGAVDVISASDADDKVAWYRNSEFDADGAEVFAYYEVSSSAQGARSVYACAVTNYWSVRTRTCAKKMHLDV